MPHRNLVAIAAVGLASVVCWQSSRGDSKDEMMELYGIFVDAVEQVESNYVREVPRRELLEAALQGMLQSLDPHSTYYSEAEWKQFQSTFEGSFTGIGIQVEVDAKSKRLKVLAPLIGTPAYEAGVLAGDLILEVDGESTEGITQDKAVELLQGRPGTSVTLNVLHPGSEKAETLTVTREVIASESVLGVERRPDDSW
jgi:carboxyl-terminal processing protease